MERLKQSHENKYFKESNTNPHISSQEYRSGFHFSSHWKSAAQSQQWQRVSRKCCSLKHKPYKKKKQNVCFFEEEFTH